MLKAVFGKWLSCALVVTIMLQCSPLIGSMMTGMLGRFTLLADDIVSCDSAGNVQFSGQGAEDLLDQLGAKSEEFTGVLDQVAHGFLSSVEAEAAEKVAEEYGSVNDFLNEIRNRGLGALFAFPS